MLSLFGLNVNLFYCVSYESDNLAKKEMPLLSFI